jgi:hypothetical protein
VPPGRHLPGVLRLADERLEIEDLEDPLKAHERAHDVDADVRQGRERPVEAGEQQREGHDGAGAELPGEDQRAAQPVGEGLREAGHERERHDERARVHRGRDAYAAHPVGLVREVRGLGLGATEELHEHRAAHVEPLGHLRVHGRVEVEALLGERGELAPDPLGGDQEHRDEHQ